MFIAVRDCTYTMILYILHGWKQFEYIVYYMIVFFDFSRYASNVYYYNVTQHNVHVL